MHAAIQMEASHATGNLVDIATAKDTHKDKAGLCSKPSVTTFGTQPLPKGQQAISHAKRADTTFQHGTNVEGF